VVLDVVLELSVVVVTSVVDVVSVVVVVVVVSVVVVVVVVVLVVVVVVDVVLGESAASTSFTQPSTTVSRVAAVVVLEQSVADVSLAIAAANLLSASARQAVGSVPLVACLDRHPSSADAFLAAAATFFESHLLSVGLLSLAPTAARTLLSHVPRAETTALALPGQESWRSAFAKSFATFAPGLASQGASGAFPFDSAFASHLSVPEIALPEDLSLVPPHLSARAIAGGASNAMATARTTERRGECMSGLASQVSSLHARIAHDARLRNDRPSSSRLLPTAFAAMNSRRTTRNSSLPTALAISRANDRRDTKSMMDVVTGSRRAHDAAVS